MAIIHVNTDSFENAVLKSDNPALGIWNIKQQNKADIARKIIAEEAGTAAAYNAAFGLALLNDTSVTGLLKEIIERDDRTPVNATLRYSAERRISAIYLLGRLRQAETADFLISQLDKRDCEKFFGHTVMALLKVGEANVSSREKIGSVLKEIAEDTSWQMIEQLKEDYIRTGRSKGIGEAAITWRHAFRNSMISVVTVVGMQFGFLLGGSVITEAVFAYNGIGQLLVTSVSFRDYPCIQSLILIFSLHFIVINFVVDILYAILNPEIQLS